MSEETGNHSPLHQVEELWKQWIETTSQASRQSFATNSDPFGLTTRWLEMMEETRLNLLHETAIPNDPFTFFKQWYESSHEAWSKSSEEIIGNDKFVEAASRYMESYTTFYKNFSHLQLATRSDLTRVAELIIALENKVDSLQDASEDLQSHYPQLAAMQPLADHLQSLVQRVAAIESRLGELPSTLQKSEPDTHLEKRLDRVEQKLDTLITLLTQTNVHQPTEATTNSIVRNTKTRKAPKTPKKVSEDTLPSIEDKKEED
jgi:DNA repair ATPase RecN